MNIPISVDLDRNAPDFAEKEKAHYAAIEMAASALDMMLLDGWREIASMPIVTPDSQSIQIILFKDTRPESPRLKLSGIPMSQSSMLDLMKRTNNYIPPLEAIDKKTDVKVLNGE